MAPDAPSQAVKRYPQTSLQVLMNTCTPYTTLIVAWALNGHGKLGSNLIETELATKLPPTVCAARTGGLPGAVRLTSCAYTYTRHKPSSCPPFSANNVGPLQASALQCIHRRSLPRRSSAHRPATEPRSIFRSDQVSGRNRMYKVPDR
jgi:hypothetical protein